MATYLTVLVLGDAVGALVGLGHASEQLPIFAADVFEVFVHHDLSVVKFGYD
jgi:hypothetical protein